MEISIILVFAVVFVTAQALYEPPKSFCESIKKNICPEHPSCIQVEATTESKQDKDEEEDDDENEPETEPAKPLEYDSFLKEKLVRMVNYVRNAVACGEPPLVNFANQTLPKAAKMQLVNWDDELEWAANLFVMADEEIDAGCKITPTFRNLVEMDHETENPYFDYQKHSKLWNFISEMFPSFLFLSVKAIEMYEDNEENDFLEEPTDTDYFREQVGNEMPQNSTNSSYFLAHLLNDNVDKMGCASKIVSTEKGKMSVVTKCLFSEKVRQGSAIYKSSMVSGSSCEKLHSELKCLCSNEELETKSDVPVTFSYTNVPIRIKPTEIIPIVHHRHSPTCPTIIRVMGKLTTTKTSTTERLIEKKILTGNRNPTERLTERGILTRNRNPSIPIPYCDEISGSIIHLPGIFVIVFEILTFLI